MIVICIFNFSNKFLEKFNEFTIDFNDLNEYSDLFLLKIDRHRD